MDGEATGPGAQALERALRAVADGAGLEARVEVHPGEDGGLAGRIEGAGADALIGRGGEIIDAIQYLATQVVSRAEGGARRRVLVDADGYRTGASGRSSNWPTRPRERRSSTARRSSSTR